MKKYTGFILPVVFAWISLLQFSCNKKSSGDQTLHDIEFDQATIKGNPGFFRVGQSADGQWWFITPDDKPFFYKGVCAVNRAGTAGGRRAKDGPYAKVIDEKYGYQENPDSFVFAQINRLEEWGFNALGAWTTEEFFECGFSYTEIIEFFKEGPFIQLPGSRKPMPDIFDPQWIQAVNSKSRTLCSPKRFSKDLVGYFTDNEIGFGRPADFGLDLGFENAGRFGFSLLRGLLGLEEGIPARERAWEFLMDRYENLEALSKAWGQKILSEKDIHRLNEDLTPIITEAYRKDAKDFQLVWAEHYFRTVYETIKRYDPNHLVLGCRFGSPPDSAVLRVMTPWVDVISQNNYRPVLYQRIDYLYENTHLPVLIGEFSWNPDLFKYVPLINEPPGGYSIKERVFRKGEEVLLRASTHPAMVGYTWYRWVQGSSDGERFTYGLVDYNDQPEMHIPRLKKVNPKIEPLRLQIAREGANPSKQISGKVILLLEEMRPGWNHMLNLEVDNGYWLPEAFGWQMEGKNMEGMLSADDVALSITVEFKEWYWRGQLALEAGLGKFEVKMNRNGQKLNGTYTGDYNGSPVKGRAEGYFLPSLPVEYITGNQPAE